MKNELRKEFKKKRAELTDKKNKSLEICNIFLNSDTYKNAKIILCYSAINGEVDTGAVIDKTLADGKILALPRCIDKNGIMNYYIIDSLNSLAEGMFGISEPDASCKLLDDFTDSVCIVPALSFDKKGYRLGYGKGYYDRFLEKYNGISVGLCYNDLISEYLPINKFDKNVNAVITENEIFFCKGE